MRHAVWILGFLLTATACKKAAPTSTDAGFDRTAAPEEDDDIQPVYPTDIKEIPVAVSKLCRALHERPKIRRAECCERKPGIVLTSECERNLAGAMLVGGVKLDEGKVASCAAAIEKQYEGCNWVAPSPLPTPPECLGLVSGSKKMREKCRSTLECDEGLLCHGLSPTDVGTCGPSAPPGIACNTGVDPLVAYLRQTNIDRRRPVCVGFCDRNRCRGFLEPGAACVSNVQCGEGHRCKEGTCQPGAIAAAGEPCIGGDCAAGLKCANKKCAAPKKAGEKCTSSSECTSVCETGVCKMSCDTAPILKKLSPPMTKPGKAKRRKKLQTP